MASTGGEGEPSEAECIEQMRQQAARLLPVSIVDGIMRRVLADAGTTLIAADARALVQECASEFVSFVASEANDRCITDKRKQISGEDVLDSLKALGFDSYVAPLTHYNELVMENHG